MTDMTQAPTPGPLTAESVKLLVKGDLLQWRGTAISLVRFHHANVMGVQVIDPRDGRRWTASPSSLTFIGRPEPGAWNDRATTDCICVTTGNGSEGCGLCNETGLRPSLAPTAPVEASGSEREGEPTELEMQRAEVVTALLRYSFEGGAACDVADEIIGLLRPQPSGETQEAVSALMRKPLAAVTSLDGTVKMPMVCLSVEERDAILALIRPAPVAETAGEAVAMEIVSYDIYPGACWISPSRADEYRKEYGCVLRPLYASPVPAQDDDKLRIAVEALEKAEAEFEAIRLVLINHLNEPERAAFWKAVYGRGSAQDALATLKSTAAQEGRE